MPTIQELREQRDAKAREVRNIMDKTPQDKWTAEESAKVDLLLNDIERLDDDIERFQKVLNVTADEVMSGAVNDACKRLERDKPGTPAALFAKWLRVGDKGLTAEDWKQVNAALSTGTGSEGGYTVQSEVAKYILDALKAYGGMRSVATVVQTSQGNPMSWPTSDGTSEEGEQVDENASATDSDTSFGTLGLPVYRYSSKTIAVPNELLTDANIDLEAFLRKRIRDRIGRITNRKFTVGTGSNEPRGILTAAGAGKVGASGQVATVTYDDFVDLEHSVDPAYREDGCGWMFHDNTLKGLKKMKDTQGRPLWLPDVIGGAPATFMNYGYTINQHMPVMAANAKSILFGKLDSYMIRDVLAMEFHRFTDSAYAKKGQTGFLAFVRSGGNLMDVGGAVKYYQNSAS